MKTSRELLVPSLDTTRGNYKDREREREINRGERRGEERVGENKERTKKSNERRGLNCKSCPGY